MSPRDQDASRLNLQYFEHLAGAELIDVEPLVEPFLYRGELHLWCGPRNGGKTTLSCAVGAALSNGGYPFDPEAGSLEGPCSVAYISLEDGDPRKRFLKRWRLYKGDDERLLFRHRSAILPADLKVIRSDFEEYSEKTGRAVDVAFVDPAASVLQGDGDKGKDVRPMLDGCIQLADELDVAVVLLAHPRKGMGSRPGGDVLDEVMGSGQWTAAPRTVCFVVRHPQDRTQRLVTIEKRPSTPDDAPTTLTFKLVDTDGHPSVQWGPRLDKTYDELRTEAFADQAENSASQSRGKQRHLAAGYLAALRDTVGQVTKEDLGRVRSMFDVSERAMRRAITDAQLQYKSDNSGGERWE